MSRWDDTPVPRGDAYDARWQKLEAAGQAIHGEADFVSARQPARVLDAGCGTGRVAIELARRGTAVVGVDRDQSMLATARRNGPDIEWVEADLAELALEDPDPFDLIVAAGNVMIFLAPGTEGRAVARLAAHLAPAGHLVAGFSLSHDGYGLQNYDDDCRAAGLALVERWATWEGEPWTAAADYAVSVHGHAAACRPTPADR